MKYTEKQLIEFAEYALSRSSENIHGISDAVFQDWNEGQSASGGKLEESPKKSKLRDEKYEALDKLSSKIFKFTEKYLNLHESIIVTKATVELVEGKIGFVNDIQTFIDLNKKLKNGDRS